MLSFSNGVNTPRRLCAGNSKRKKVSLRWIFPSIALRRSAVSTCQDTRIIGICDVVLDSIKAAIFPAIPIGIDLSYDGRNVVSLHFAVPPSIVS